MGGLKHAPAGKQRRSPRGSQGRQVTVHARGLPACPAHGCRGPPPTCGRPSSRHRTSRARPSSSTIKCSTRCTGRATVRKRSLARCACVRGCGGVRGCGARAPTHMRARAMHGASSRSPSPAAPRAGACPAHAACARGPQAAACWWARMGVVVGGWRRWVARLGLLQAVQVVLVLLRPWQLRAAAGCPCCAAAQCAAAGVAATGRTRAAPASCRACLMPVVPCMPAHVVGMHLLCHSCLNASTCSRARRPWGLHLSLHSLCSISSSSSTHQQPAASSQQQCTHHDRYPNARRTPSA